MNKTNIIIVFITLIISTSAWGFHDSGVASCDGCHIIHNSVDDNPFDPNSPSGNMYLLKAETASDLCLSCHATQYGAVFGTDPLNPPLEKGAGNFVFLLEDNINDIIGSFEMIDGNSAGHNINAPSKGIGPDPNYTTAPGGSFSSNLLGCTSCHDPHGNGNFRMLHGIGPIQNNEFNFVYDAPDAEGIDISFTVESESNHTAYKSGMSDWCANCHGSNYHMRGQNNSNLRHIVDKSFSNKTSSNYNVYNGSDDMVGGNFVTAYLVDVPFEDLSNTTDKIDGSSMSSRLMCLSCHRAHATSSPQAGRWDFHVEYLQDDGVPSGSNPIPVPYNNTQQAKLCEKCHATQVEIIPADIPIN